MLYSGSGKMESGSLRAVNLNHLNFLEQVLLWEHYSATKTLSCSFELWDPAYKCKPCSEPDKIVLNFRIVRPPMLRNHFFMIARLGKRDKELSPVLRYIHLSLCFLCLLLYSQRVGGF